MLTAAAGHLGEIKTDKSFRLPSPAKSSESIVFPDSGAEEKKTAVAGASTEPATRAEVEVLRFDEKTGQMQNVQVQFSTQQKAKEAAIEVLWMQWHEQNLAMGAKDADKACVAAMLQNIHAHFNVYSQRFLRDATRRTQLRGRFGKRTGQ